MEIPALEKLIQKNTASRILATNKVEFGTAHSFSTKSFSKDEGANSIDNINDASAGKPAMTVLIVTKVRQKFIRTKKVTKKYIQMKFQ